MKSKNNNFMNKLKMKITKDPEPSAILHRIGILSPVYPGNDHHGYVQIIISRALQEFCSGHDVCIRACHPVNQNITEVNRRFYGRLIDLPHRTADQIFGDRMGCLTLMRSFAPEGAGTTAMVEVSVLTGFVTSLLAYSSPILQ